MSIRKGTLWHKNNFEFIISLYFVIFKLQNKLLSMSCVRTHIEKEKRK